jgi:hypothetical protein
MEVNCHHFALAILPTMKKFSQYPLEEMLCGPRNQSDAVDKSHLPAGNHTIICQLFSPLLFYRTDFVFKNVFKIYRARGTARKTHLYTEIF